MKTLTHIIHKPGMSITGRILERHAVRAICMRGAQILMVFSASLGDYKFPGGGVQADEQPEVALQREVLEECGARLLEIQRPFGQIIEYDTALEPDYDVFRMISAYYICQIEQHFGLQSLDEYEYEAGFTPVWIDLDEVIQANTDLLEQGRAPRWTQRELFVLNQLAHGIS